MRFKCPSSESRAAKRKMWQRKFVIFPRRLSDTGECAWLETVWCRGIPREAWDTDIAGAVEIYTVWEYEYRAEVDPKEWIDERREDIDWGNPPTEDSGMYQ